MSVPIDKFIARILLTNLKNWLYCQRKDVAPLTANFIRPEQFLLFRHFFRWETSIALSERKPHWFYKTPVQFTSIGCLTTGNLNWASVATISSCSKKNRKNINLNKHHQNQFIKIHLQIPHNFLNPRWIHDFESKTFFTQIF